MKVYEKLLSKKSAVRFLRAESLANRVALLKRSQSLMTDAQSLYLHIESVELSDHGCQNADYFQQFLFNITQLLNTYDVPSCAIFQRSLNAMVRQSFVSGLSQYSDEELRNEIKIFF